MAEVKRDFRQARISEKLKALLAIAGKVQQGGKNVLAEDVERARREGATDLEIHDTVLIAAAFCMYNRYVDGLATWAPENLSSYRERAAKVAAEGYSANPHRNLNVDQPPRQARRDFKSASSAGSTPQAAR